MNKLQLKTLKTAMTIIKSANRYDKRLPLLNSALIETGSITFTSIDLLITLDIDIPCTESICIPLDSISTALKVSSDLAITRDGEEYIINGLRTATYPATDFPYPPMNFYDETHTLNIDAIKRCAPAMAKQDPRYYLNGMLFDYAKGNLVAADGHRLHIMMSQFDNGAGADIIHCDTVHAMIKLGATSIQRGGSHSRVTFPGGTIITKHVEGEFPDYERAMPKVADLPHSSPIVAKTLEAIKFAHAVSQSNLKPVTLDFDAGVATSKDCYAGYDTCLHGKGKFHAQGQYLIDAFAQTNADDAFLHYADIGNTGAIQEALLIQNGIFNAVVMPLRA